MKEKLMMIINPAAGKSGYEAGLAPALRSLGAAGYAPALYFTDAPGDATRFAAEHGGEYEKLIVLGGDGTLSETVSGLMRIEKRPAVGYIPLGTANDVARTLRLPKNDIPAAVRRFIDGEATPFDVGSVDGRSFNYIAAFGAFTEVSYATPQKLKKTWGELAYLAGGVKSLAELKSRHVRISYDNGEIDGDYLYGSVSNSRSVAGVVELPKEDVSLSDGLHELILLKMPENAAKFAALAARVFNKDLDSEYIEIYHTKRAHFEFDEPVSWTFDGEDGGEHQTLDTECCRHAISVIH